MGVSTTPLKKNKRAAIIMISMVLALTAVMVMARALIAAGNETAAAALSASKTVNRAQVAVAITDTVQYTIIISNSGDATAGAVVMTDTLDSGLTYAGGLGAQVISGTGTVGASNNIITWTGSLDGGGLVTITFQAAVSNSLPAGTILTNTAEITGTGALLTPAVATEIVSPTAMYLPILFKSPPQLALQVTRPNSANEWTASWGAVGNGVTGYELQESHDPDFGGLTAGSPGAVGLNTSYNFTNNASTDNVYYYRARALAGSFVGPWSNVPTVIGGYRDDFNDDSTGWAVRRMTYLEKTFAKYGTGNEAGNLVIIVDDRWDWMIASPLAPAPSLPYVIEYQARVHDSSNLVSGGMTFGGDWNYDACPEFGNVYQTDNCFNHFYNFNYIFYGPIKLLFEQVDTLYWCPNCGQSPLKRLGPTEVVDPVVDNANGKVWHTYRVEVRSDGAHLYIDGSFVKQFTDTTWINGPYFGVFASTDEYKPSIWLYEYFQVMPLD